MCIVCIVQNSGIYPPLSTLCSLPLTPFHLFHIILSSSFKASLSSVRFVLFVYLLILSLLSSFHVIMCVLCGIVIPVQGIGINPSRQFYTICSKNASSVGSKNPSSVGLSSFPVYKSVTHLPLPLGEMPVYSVLYPEHDKQEWRCLWISSLLFSLGLFV